MAAQTPQAGIIPEPNQHALFLVTRANNPTATRETVAGVVAGIPELVTAVGGHDTEAALVCTVSFGSGFWDVLSPGRRPKAMRPFTAIDLPGKTAPSTGGDILFHLISKRLDLNFELAKQIRSRLGEAIDVLDEVHGFRYLDSRDLTGFIDGTENPSGDEERAEVALIGDEDADFAGGSYVFTQRYVHNFPKWQATSQDEQEGAVGRRKVDSEELSDKVKPPTAHISRVVIEENGEELEILRHSFPYGTTSEAGLFFIAYTKDLDITDKMLRRMLGASDDGLHDHLMDYTQAVSGAHFFAPSLEMLQALGK